VSVPGRRNMGRLRTSPARQHRRRRHVPADLRERAYLGRILSRAQLDLVYTGVVADRKPRPAWWPR
jgi:hypothetical protein